MLKTFSLHVQLHRCSQVDGAHTNGKRLQRVSARP